MNQTEHNVCIIRLLEEGYSLRKLEKAVIQARVDWAEICDERDANVSRLPACKGTNCGCTDGRSHSPECVAEYEECTKLPYDEKYLHHPDTGTGWKCYVCGYGGAANNYANTFCVNCHCHR